MSKKTTKRHVLIGMGAIGLMAAGCQPPSRNAFTDLLDHILRLLAEHHFDYARIKGLIDAKAENYRQIAAKANNPAEAYFEALFPFVSELAKTSSHLALHAGELTLPRGRWFPLPEQPRGASPPFPPADLANLGASLAWTGEAYRVVAINPDNRSNRLKLHQNLQLETFPETVGDRRHVSFTEVGSGRRINVSYPTNSKPPLLWSRVLDNETAYLRFDQFTPETVAQVIAAIDQLPPRIILDLRANTGGHIRAAERLWSRIMPPESNILDALYQGKTYRFKTPAGPKQDLRFAVLISPKTASSAEITASALVRHRGSVLIGEQTAGSVLLSQYYPLPDGGKLQIPIAKLSMPDGSDLEGHGLMPNLTTTSAPPQDAFVRKAYDMIMD